MYTLEALSHFILRHKIHQYYPKKAVANKWLNGTTESVEEIKHHHAEQVN